jgi:uncharacterized alpha-E superfamily protein
MLLSRVAEQLYWGGRHLERAEDTARIVIEHTNLLIDLPTSVPLNWEPLLAVTGSAQLFDEQHDERSERNIVSFLLGDDTNNGSVVQSVANGRDNLRSCREILPSEAWVAVNDLYLFTQQHGEAAVERPSRVRFCRRVVTDHQMVLGMIAGSMLRDPAYAMLRLGRHLERADMTTRILDVRATALLRASGDVGDAPFAEVQSISLLRSLLALQTFHRRVPGSPTAASAMAFALHETSFPRSVAYCLDALLSELTRLPQPSAAVRACETARQRLAGMTDEAPSAIRIQIDELQLDLAAVHSAITDTYFAP